ncbi:MAG: universal stress protein [Chitinophagales bacterium]|nr:universal stress protein [Chitinophagales bacterium]MDW8272973.1 universal stress protein [Chitinophagales bacterium]
MERLKVLIPTDFSVQADYAYIMVKKLEEKIPVEIHFLHILSVPDTVTMDEGGKINTCGEIDVRHIETQRDIALNKLNNLKIQYGNDIHVHLRVGKVTDGIISFAQSIHADLIAMGTKGAFGWKEKLSGSETQMIARRSPIPVLSLMCDRSDLQIRNILLVHDFSKPEKLDLSLLKKLVQAFGCTLHLLQITSGDPESEKDEFEKKTAEFASLNQIENYRSHLIKDTDVEQGVIHFNQMHEMDMVCIGTHGKGGWLHSSATEKLINHLFKPMITFHIN